jgi:hypothetical protein
LSVSTENPQYRHEKYNEFDEQIKFWKKNEANLRAY